MFHTARLFDAEPWHIKDAGRYLAADLLIAGFNIVQMPLLFFLAGITAFHSLDSRGPGRFVRERFLRLLVPLVVGMVLAVPPQVYAERAATGLAGRASPIDFSGSYLEFYPHFFACCYPDANLSWHHLWFILYLFVYSLVLLPPFLLLRRPGGLAALQRMGHALTRGARVLLLAIPLLVAELALRRAFPSTHAFVDDFANHTHFAVLMLTGWLFAASPDLATAAQRLWRPLVITAAGLVLAWLALRASGFPLPFPARQALRVVAEWSALAGLVGLAAERLSRPLPFLTGFSALSFPFYVFHQTVIVLLGFWLLSWTDAPLTKFVAVAGLSIALSLALARAVAFLPVTRLMFGVR